MSALGSRLGLDIEAAGLIIPAGDENPTGKSSQAFSPHFSAKLNGSQRATGHGTSSHFTHQRSS